jgi:hypothetical protein
MDYGIVDLAGNVCMWVQCVNDARTPTAPDATPTFRIYGPAGTTMTDGTGTFEATIVDSRTGLYLKLMGCTAQRGYQQGVTYTVEVRYLISAVLKVELHSFLVV